jgi:hypothetical protein
MLGFWRKDDAWDPELFLTGIAAVLALYPREVIDRVVHPAFGLPSTLRFPPTPAEVKEACEKAVRPIRDREEAEKRERDRKAVLEEEAKLAADRKRRKTYEEIKAEFAQVGIHLGGRAPEARSTEPVDTLCARLGCTKEQWDAIPNAPKRDVL